MLSKITNVADYAQNSLSCLHEGDSNQSTDISCGFYESISEHHINFKSRNRCKNLNSNCHNVTVVLRLHSVIVIFKIFSSISRKRKLMSMHFKTVNIVISKM